MKRISNSKEKIKVKEQDACLLIPIFLFLLNQFYPCKTLPYIIFIIPFVYLFLGQLYAAFLYCKLKTKYNYWPHNWVQAPGKHSTYHKTLQYLTERNDIEYIEKFKKMNHNENITIIMFIETIILFILGIII